MIIWIKILKNENFYFIISWSTCFQYNTLFMLLKVLGRFLSCQRCSFMFICTLRCCSCRSIRWLGPASILIFLKVFLYSLPVVMQLNSHRMKRIIAQVAREFRERRVRLKSKLVYRWVVIWKLLQRGSAWRIWKTIISKGILLEFTLM